MKSRSYKFLQFNGKSIYFLNVDGTYYVAVKPICDALNIDSKQQIKNIKKHQILGDVGCVHTLRDSLERMQNMFCLPEQYVYGWIFSIRSKSEDLAEYQRECYDVLYKHFHGGITELSKTLKKKSEHVEQRNQVLNRLSANSDFLKLKEIEKFIKKDNQEIAQSQDAIKNQQLNLFKN